VTVRLLQLNPSKNGEMMIQAGRLSFDLTKAADARVASDRVEQDFSVL